LLEPLVDLSCGRLLYSWCISRASLDCGSSRRRGCGKGALERAVEDGVVPLHAQADLSAWSIGMRWRARLSKVSNGADEVRREGSLMGHTSDPSSPPSTAST